MNEGRGFLLHGCQDFQALREGAGYGVWIFPKQQTCANGVWVTIGLAKIEQLPVGNGNKWPRVIQALHEATIPMCSRWHMVVTQAHRYAYILPH